MSLQRAGCSSRDGSRSLRHNQITTWQHAERLHLPPMLWRYTRLADFRTLQRALRRNLIGRSHNRCLRGGNDLFSVTFWHLEELKPAGVKDGKSSIFINFFSCDKNNADARYGNVWFVTNLLGLSSHFMSLSKNFDLSSTPDNTNNNILNIQMLLIITCDVVLCWPMCSGFSWFTRKALSRPGPEQNMEGF